MVNIEQVCAGWESEVATRRVFYEKVFLNNFVKLTGNHLCRNLFFNKVQVQTCNFIKKKQTPRYFPVNCVKFVTTTFLTEHLRNLKNTCPEKF